MQPYQHESLDLDPGSIRILNVLPHDIDGTVRCTINKGNLDSPFSALSYTWGSPNTTKQIFINNRPFTVRQNLFDFLYMISRQRPGSRLWIDAICIDQINDTEKSHQVLQMGNIYAAAQEVLVWLGNDRALQDWFEAMNGRSWADAPSQGVNMPLGRRAWLDGFKLLMLHPYWTRLWITQELLLGRNTKLMAGESSISLKFFRSQYDMYRLDARKLLDPAKASRIFQLLARKYETDKQFAPYSLGIRAAFAIVADSFCHDPRDRIFGLISLIEGGQDFPLKYSDSHFCVFLRAIVQFNDKYMSCLLLELLNPRSQSIHTDLKALMKSGENLTFNNVNLLHLEQVTSHGRSELCHRHLRQELKSTNQQYIWCVELYPKKNWQGKYLNHCTTLHVVFEQDSRSGVYRSVDTVCQRDIDNKRASTTDEFAERILVQAKKAIQDGSIIAARPLQVTSINHNHEGYLVQVVFPLALLSQLFWYLLKPQLKIEDERDGIDIWNGTDVFKVCPDEARQQILAG